jgi:hypothetical protein
LTGSIHKEQSCEKREIRYGKWVRDPHTKAKPTLDELDDERINFSGGLSGDY